MAEDLVWLGQSSFRINTDSGIVIYIDPWDLKTQKYKADIILITHSHDDHCSQEDIDKIIKKDTIIIAPPDCSEKIKQEIVPIEPYADMEEKDVDIETVPAYNLYKSAHPRINKWVGYILMFNKKSIYHTGDTDLIPEMKKIKTDIMLIPVGGDVTMNADEAAEIVNRIRPRLAIPMHYGAFIGSNKDAERFKSLCNVPVEIQSPEK